MNILNEAARIVEAAFAQRAALAVGVEGFDPLTGKVTWRNNKLTQGASVIVGYAFGSYDSATNKFYLAGFKADNVDYVWGSAIVAAAPAQGTSASPDILSYALNVAAQTTFDVLVFVATGTLGLYAADYKKGSRTIGLKLTDFAAITVIGSKVYTAQLTVSPYALPAEVVGFSVSKG
jgi:hypothetical protein